MTVLGTLHRMNIVTTHNGSGHTGEVLFDMDGTPVRVRAHCDFYESQSWGVLERWDGAGWANVASLPTALVHGYVDYRADDGEASKRFARLANVALKEFGWVMV